MKNLSFNKGRPSCLCIIIFAILLSNHMYAIELTFGSYTKQLQHQITGTVTDATGPLPSVTVIVKGTTTSAVTDEKGNFSIMANSADIIIFSFIGYVTQEKTVGNQTSINVILSEDSTQLKEVTINAGYYSVKEKEKTGSIAKIKAVDIEKQPVSNPLAAMQGRMSGVNITQTTGIAGGGFSIQVRGLNSIRGEGNDPLYIVDGVPYSSQSLGNDDLSSGTLPSNISPLNSLSPSNIESIEVLKDADATAIYGSRGANGVVLITTKKGKAGQTRFNINAYTTVGKITRKLHLMNTQQYLAMRAEAFQNDGITEYPESAYDINGTWDPNRYTDWQKKLIGGTALINNAEATVSGGSAETQFMLSGTYRRETSVFPGDTHYGKGAVHTSITHKSSDEKFKLMLSADYTGDKNTLPGNDLTRFAYQTSPNAPSLYSDNGELNWENGTFNNPLAYLQGTYLTNSNNLISNALLSYILPAGFELKTSLGFNDYKLSEKRTSPSTIYNPADEIGVDASTLYLNSATLRSWIIEPQLSWQKKWNDLNCSFLVGATFQNQVTSRLTEIGYGFQGNALINDLAAASIIEVTDHSTTEYKYQAVFARFNINFKERYILNLTARRDGSSRFGPENRFAHFGAVGGAWIFSNESIFKNNTNWISFGKLRTSYGITGNDQIGDYQYFDTYDSTSSNYNGVIGIRPTHLFNADFSWETNKKLEAAIELGFLRDNIFLTAAWFRNRSSNQLVGVPLPTTTGFSSVQANLNATVQNSGFEIDLRT
ncbi:MAG: SusC/RagA family TonB-linked outer membrane protein, partial [Flavobacterium sp.]|nr:SusC/RagA family TonB-linked outer membrane protein [Flavobacterium sp.]